MRINAEALRQLLKSRDYILIPSRGTSMAPIIRTGNICRFEPVKLEDLQAGDIVLYISHTGELVGHRYIGSFVRDRETFYVCKGDFNQHPDAPISADQIVGRMAAIFYSKFHLSTDGLSMKLWGTMVVKYPALSRCVRYGIRLKRKAQGLISNTWTS